MRFTAWDLKKARAYYNRFTTDVTIEKAKSDNYYILTDHFTGKKIVANDVHKCMKRYNPSVPYNWNNDPQLVEMFGPCPSDWDRYHDTEHRNLHTLTVEGKLVGYFENPEDMKAYSCHKYSVRKTYTAIVGGAMRWCKVCNTCALALKASKTPNIPIYREQKNGVFAVV